jgi:hypothetical protein
MSGVRLPSGDGTGKRADLLLALRDRCDRYPESGKLELRPSGMVFRLADSVDFWDGEV